MEAAVGGCPFWRSRAHALQKAQDSRRPPNWRRPRGSLAVSLPSSPPRLPAPFPFTVDGEDSPLRSLVWPLRAIRGGAGYRVLGDGFAARRWRRSRCGSVGERKGRSGGTNGVRDGNPTCAVWCAGGMGASGRWIARRQTDVVLAGLHAEGRKVRRSFNRIKTVSPL